MIQIVNCLQCSRPLQKRGNVQVCKRCMDEETNVYEFYYEQLRRKVNQLSYKYIAQRGHMDEKRLRDTCQFRMGVGRQDLEGWKRGLCNICYKTLPNPESFEPICVRCLEHVLKMVTKHPEVAFEKEFREEATKTAQKEKTSAKLTEARSEKTELSLETTNAITEADETINYKKLYEAAKNTLIIYEQKYGPLETSPVQNSVVSDPVNELVVKNTVISKTESTGVENKIKQRSAHSSEDILNILETVDEELPLSDEEMRLLERFAPENVESNRCGFKSQAS